jgi:tetraacyldisaccharide 4'-kinase
MYLSEKFQVSERKFADHHAFNKQDIQEIHRNFDTFANKEMAIVTTEKDWVKLQSLLSETDLQTYPWCVLPMTVKLQDEQTFNSMILNYVRNN